MKFKLSLRNSIVIIIIGLLLVSCNTDDDAEANNSENFPTRIGVGESAQDLLTETRFQRLVIEVGYMEGFALSSQAETEVIRFLEETVNKSAGIEIIHTEIPSQTLENYSSEDLREIESDNRQRFPSGEELTVWVSVVNGRFEDNSVIGVAYQNLSTALMGESISENTGGFNQASRSSIEAAVLMHELSHLLGLVNITTPMINEHQGNGNHCDNSDCLMNSAIETTNVFGIMESSPIPELDENCRLDLQNNGGK